MPRKRLNNLSTKIELEYAEGKRKEKGLPQGPVLSSYVLRTIYDSAIAGGGAGAVHAYAGHRLPNVLTLMVDGKPMIHAKPRTLAIAQELFATPDVQIPPTSVAAGADENDRLANIRIPLTLEKVGKQPIRDPYQIALPTSYSKVALIIDWGRHEDLFTSALTGAPTIDNVVPTLFEEELVGAQNVPGYAPLVIRHQEFDIVNSGLKAFELDIVENGFEILALIIETLEDAAGGENWAHVDTVVDHMVVEIAGDEIQEQIDWGVMQEQNVPRFELAAKKTGVVVLDAMEDGSIEPGAVWFQRGANKARIVAEVNAPAVGGKRQICVAALMTGGPARRERAKLNLR